MFICKDCGHVYLDDCNCPVCGSCDYELAYFCSKCEEWKPGDEMDSEHCCKVCTDRAITEENFYKYLSECGLERDFFVEFCTDSDFGVKLPVVVSSKLLHICKSFFFSLPATQRKKKIRTFINQDRAHFAGWFETT